MIRPLAFAFLASVSTMAAAQTEDTPATASSVAGTVQVNRGEAFVPLAAGEQVAAGDRVMALDDSKATLKFTDGCTLVVEEETVVVVPAISPCKGGIATVQSITPASTGAVGATGGVDWPGFWTVAAVAIVGNALLWEYGNDTASP